MDVPNDDVKLMKFILGFFWLVILTTFVGLSVLLATRGDVAMIIFFCALAAMSIAAVTKHLWRSYNKPTTQRPPENGIPPGDNSLYGVTSVETASDNRLTIEMSLINSETNHEIILNPRLLPLGADYNNEPPDYGSVVGQQDNENVHTHSNENMESPPPGYYEAFQLHKVNLKRQ